MHFKFLFYFILLFAFISSDSQRNLLEEEDLSDDIVILHTNDVHCGIDDYIGYDGLMLFKKELKQKYKNVLLVDAGDHVQGGSVGLLSRGEDIIKIMNKLEYDFVTLGNHEFDYQLETLYNLNEKMNHSYVCANFVYRKNDSTIFDPYRIIQVGNINIGFIGLVTLQALTKTYLHTLVDENNTLIYDLLNDETGKKLYNKVQGYIDELRNEHVDYVIIVCHFGYGGDALPKYTSKALLGNLTGVDAIIDGHTHLVYNSPFKDAEDKDVYICQAGTKLTHLGKITIKPNKNITSEMFDEIPLFDGYKDYKRVERGGKKIYVDPEMNQFLRDIYESHGEEIKEVLGETEFDLPIDGKGVGENNLCDLVTDSMRYYGKSDICLINSGSVRSDIKKGNITYNDVLNALPFSSKVIVMEVTGQDILDALEFGMKNLPGYTSRFPQVSGISFKVNLDIPSSVEVNEIESFVRVTGERRVYDISVGNEALDLNKKYNVTLDDYMGEGGDGYSMFIKYNITQDYPMMSEVCKNYIEDVLNRTIPNIYKQTQGRITIIKSESKPNSNDFMKYMKELYLLLFLLII